MCCEEPTPEVPKESLPGFLLPYAISSLNVVTGSDGCTTTDCGAVPTMIMGVKSLTVSNGTFLMKNGYALCGGPTVRSSV